MSANYDVIGDIHGYANHLRALLKKLGYREHAGVFRQAGRKVLFVGDLVDRGPEQMETIRIVRSMVDAGYADIVMGNHEYNAVCYATPDPNKPNEFLRRHLSRNKAAHQSFLDQAKEGSALYTETIEWFKTLPVYLDLENIRVIHACWHTPSLEIISAHLDEQARLKEDSWHESATKGTDLYHALEILLKGMEIALPEGVSYLDKDGTKRTKTRTRWWDEHAETLHDYAHARSDVRASISRLPIPESDRMLYDKQKPLFVGHYWLTGNPEPLSELIACLDYSIGKGSPKSKLCAYRWEGETKLCRSKFIWVDGSLDNDATYSDWQI